MKTPTIYLETAIFNFPFADDAPQYRADTLKLFEEIKAGNFKAYTSEYVQNELNGERHEEKREKMLKLITEYNISVPPPMVDIINKTNGYKGMFIHSPAEIIENA
ncbi:MAG: hypothetical protein Pg6C_03600 [Treponemataceae bacterium]|nr:MAG: hypothetical protein Pg6C_03600 [Treponemataceae bacterium]